MPNSSWAPNETAATIGAEAMWFQGNVLADVGYGVVLTLSFMCFRILFLHVRDGKRAPVGSGQLSTRQSIALLVYVGLIFFFGTLFTGALAWFTQLAFVNDRNFPGGPAAFEEIEFANPVDIACSVAFVLANWMADGMMVSRFLLIYGHYKGYKRWLVAGVPCLLFLTSIILSLFWLVQICSPSSSPFSSVTSASGVSVNFTVPYLCLSLALNILLTLLIVVRILAHRQHILKYLITNAAGSKRAHDYVGIVAMLIESAALYSIFSLCFLIPFVLNSPVNAVFLSLLAEVQIIAPLLIIYRVASGRAWTRDTADRAFGTSSVNSMGGTILQLTPAVRRGFDGSGADGITASEDYQGLDSYASRDRVEVSVSEGERSPMKYLGDVKGSLSPPYSGKGIRVDVAVERNVDV